MLTLLRKKCICRKDRACKWNSAVSILDSSIAPQFMFSIQQIPRCLREDQNIERFMANDFVRPATPQRIEIEEEIENVRFKRWVLFLMILNLIQVELEMISRINEEEEKAAGKIYQIAQNHKIPISEFPFSQPVIDKGNIFLITNFIQIPNLEPESAIITKKPVRGRGGKTQAGKSKPARGRTMHGNNHLENAASQIQNAARHLQNSVDSQREAPPKPVDSGIRTLQHEGATYIHPFDFFQKLQRWMYEMGLFNYFPEQ